MNCPKCGGALTISEVDTEIHLEDIEIKIDCQWCETKHFAFVKEREFLEDSK